MSKTEHLPLPIGAVERETGISRDTLRKWELRYGFPQPQRDVHGERIYAQGDVFRLKLIKKLMNAGLRPGAVVGLSLKALEALDMPKPQASEAVLSPHAEKAIAALIHNDTAALHQLLRQQLVRQGLRVFVVDTVAELNEAVGRAWERGLLTVFQEHLYSALIRDFLEESVLVAKLPQGDKRVVLTTPNGEQHGLGLLMAKTLCALSGYQCHDLGTQLPAGEIASAAVALRVDAVALSLSIMYPRKQALAVVKELRSLLPATTGLWVGGAGAGHLGKRLAGVQVFRSMADFDAALREQADA